MNNEVIESLLKALEVSPENVPLRLHLAKTYLDANRFDESEKEYLVVLNYEPNSIDGKMGLAKSYIALQKYGAGTVVLEGLIDEGNTSLTVLELYCTCLVKSGEIEQALIYYKRILDKVPNYQNPMLDTYLRVGGIVNEENVDEDALRFLQKPKVNFDDVGGMQREKDEISLKIIKPFQHPELYKAYGKKAGGGILLYGPPGCGKTHLARATAGQVNANFISVGISEVLDMWIGSSERNLHEIFDIARKNTPCILFFDEIDALGANRNDMRQSAGRAIINQFLAELDGIDADNEGVLVLGATNTPWYLDPAFRRPGRFDRIIFVAPPNKGARAVIFELKLRNVPTENIDFSVLARATEGFSGADIESCIDVAIEEKLRESFENGEPEPLRTKEIKKAIGKTRSSTQEWFNSARNYALYSNTGGLYNDILDYLNIKKK